MLKPASLSISMTVPRLSDAKSKPLPLGVGERSENAELNRAGESWRLVK